MSCEAEMADEFRDLNNRAEAERTGPSDENGRTL